MHERPIWLAASNSLLFVDDSLNLLHLQFNLFQYFLITNLGAIHELSLKKLLQQLYLVLLHTSFFFNNLLIFF